MIEDKVEFLKTELPHIYNSGTMIEHLLQVMMAVEDEIDLVDNFIVFEDDGEDLRQASTLLDTYEAAQKFIKSRSEKNYIILATLKQE